MPINYIDIYAKIAKLARDIADMIETWGVVANASTRITDLLNQLHAYGDVLTNEEKYKLADLAPTIYDVMESLQVKTYQVPKLKEESANLLRYCFRHGV